MRSAQAGLGGAEQLGGRVQRGMEPDLGAPVAEVGEGDGAGRAAGGLLDHEQLGQAHDLEQHRVGRCSFAAVLVVDAAVERGRPRLGAGRR